MEIDFQMGDRGQSITENENLRGYRSCTFDTKFS